MRENSHMISAMLECDPIVENLRQFNMEVDDVLPYLYRLSKGGLNLKNHERLELNRYMFSSKTSHCCECLDEIDIKTKIFNIAKIYFHNSNRSNRSNPHPIVISTNNDKTTTEMYDEILANDDDSLTCYEKYENFATEMDNSERFSKKVELILRLLFHFWNQTMSNENNLLLDNYIGENLFNSELHRNEISIILNYYYQNFEQFIPSNQMCKILLLIDNGNLYYSINFLINHSYLIEDYITDVFNNYEFYSNINVNALIQQVCSYFPRYIDFIKVLLLKKLLDHDCLLFGIEIFVAISKNQQNVPAYVESVIQLLRKILLSKVENDRNFITKFKENSKLIEDIFELIVFNFSQHLGFDSDCFQLLYVLRMCFIHCENSEFYDKLWEVVFCKLPLDDNAGGNTTTNNYNTTLYYVLHALSLSIIYNYTLKEDSEFEMRIDNWIGRIKIFLIECQHIWLEQSNLSEKIIDFNLFNSLKQFIYFIHIYIDSQNYDYVIDYIKNDIFGGCYLPDVVFNNKHPSAVIMYDSKVNLNLFFEYLTLLHTHTTNQHIRDIINNIETVVTPNLCRNTVVSTRNTSVLPLHYIQRLIRLPDHFWSNIISIKEWVIRQIFECVFPLHGEICDLIEEFVQAFCNMKLTNKDYNLLKLDNNLINALFTNEIIDNEILHSIKSVPLTQYLVCFYMLLCEKYAVFPCYNSNMVVFDDDQLVQQWNMVPLKKIIITVNLDKNYNYQGDNSVAKFNAMAVDLRPQYFSNLIPHYSFVLEKTIAKVDVSSLNAEHKSMATMYAKLLRSHERLLESDAVCDNFVQFLKLYPHYASTIEDTNSSVDLTNSLTDIFKQCIVVYPEKFVFNVIEVLLSNVDITAIIKSPINLFKNSIYIFKDALLVEIFICCIDYFIDISQHFIYLQMNRVYQYDKTYNENNQTGLIAFTEDQLFELYHTICLTQKAAIIQLLIESVGYINDNRSQYEWLSMEQIHSKVGMYIHCLFVNNPNLIRLTHLQSYPISAVEWIVKHIPSIHIIHEFLPDLVVTDSYDNLECSFKLFCHLLGKYMMPRLLHFLSMFFRVFFILFEHYINQQEPSLDDIERLLSHLNCLIYNNNFTATQVVSLLRKCVVLSKKVRSNMYQHPDYPSRDIEERLVASIDKAIYVCSQHELSC